PCASSGTHLDEPFIAQHAVGPQHRVDVHVQIRREFTCRRQPLMRLQRAGSDASPDLHSDLGPQGDPARVVKPYQHVLAVTRTSSAHGRLLQALITGSPRQTDNTPGPFIVLRVSGSASVVATITIAADVLTAVQPIPPVHLRGSTSSMVTGLLLTEIGVQQTGFSTAMVSAAIILAVSGGAALPRLTARRPEACIN